MKFKVLIVAAALTMFGCHANAEDYFYLEGGIGVKLNQNNDWEGDYPSYVEFGYFRDFSSKVYGKATVRHQSNIDRGKPFNNQNESHLDYAGFAIGWKF